MNKDKDRSAAGIGGMLALFALPVLCCGLPALAAAGSLAVAGTWLTAHGLTLIGAFVLVAGAGLGARWLVTRRRCEVPRAVPPARVER